MTKCKFKLSILLTATLIAGIFTQSCGDKTSTDNASTSITRLDTALADNLIVDSIKNPMNDYLTMMGLDGSDLKSATETYRKTEAFKTFYSEVKKTLGSLDETEKALGTVNHVMAQSFPNASPQKFYGIVSPYRQQIILADSATYIVLNHYLGQDNEIYEGMPAYMKALKEKSRIPIDVAEALLRNAYPYRPNAGATTLTRMIYEGAIAHAVAQAVPSIGITEYNAWGKPEDDFAVKNETELWRTLIVNDLLYSTDPTVGDRLVADAPSSGVISGEVPAKIGRYIGYKIVDSYLSNHKDAKLEQLLQPEFYNNSSVLIESGYAPEK